MRRWHSSFINCIGIGSAPERWGKDLHGICLSAPCIHDHLRLRRVWCVHRKCLSHLVLLYTLITLLRFIPGLDVRSERRVWRM